MREFLGISDLNYFSGTTWRELDTTCLPLAGYWRGIRTGETLRSL
jgi:hypothetical protein